MAEAKRLRCPVCGKVMQKNDPVFLVRCIDGSGWDRRVPTCTEEHALVLKTQSVSMHRRRMETVEEAKLTHTTVAAWFAQHS